MQIPPLNEPMQFKIHLAVDRGGYVITILGSEEAFEQLAFRLSDALNARKEPGSQWGSSLASCEVSEVGRENNQASLSFAIDNDTLSKQKSWRPVLVTWWSATLSFIGAAALIYAFTTLWF